MNPRPYALPVSLFPLADSLPSGLVLHRSDRILFANRAMSRLTGYTADELAQMDFWAFFPKAAQGKVQEWGRMRLQGEHPPARYETLIVIKSGEERWVELTLSCEAIDGARTVLCSYLDITDRKRAEAAQAQSRQLLAQIIDGDPVPTLVINARHIVTHWNQACEQITGIRAADIVGTRKHWTAFYDHERPIMADLIVSGEIETITRHYGQKKLRRSPVVASAYEAEDFFPHFGENGRWLYFTAAPLRNAAGATIGAIETLQDITERRKAEDELRQMHTSLEAKVAQRTVELQDAKATLERDIARRETAEAELRARYSELKDLNSRLSDTQQQLVQSEKMASIGQLAAGVAHEINNPIGYVNSNIRSLKSYIAQLLGVVDAYQAREAALPEPDRAALAAARKAADFDFLREDVTQLLAESEEGTERVRKIVQDLRDFSRTEATQDWQSVDLRRGLDSTLNIASNEIKYRAEVVRDYGEMPLVECLPSQLNQVFMNLFVNAAQAMPEGHRGLITVRTGTEPAREAVWIEVADNGSGMPADVMARIFDPFFTTKPVGKGTGLGLSLSYGIIQKHHGHIGVTSTPGAGTTFRIVLPVHRALTDGATPMSEAAAPAFTLLCVDDEANILSALRRLFRPHGYTVLTAGGGEEGLEILAREPVDLIISDMRMPVMDGARFLGEARKRHPDTVRLLLTGYADMESTIEAINAGQISRYISKPWNDQDVLLTVREALERKQLEKEKARLEALTRSQNDELKSLNASLEQKVEARTAELRIAHDKLKQNFLTSIRVFSNLIELREGAMSGHSRRVADLARKMAIHLGFNATDAQDVMLAGLLHDVGKIGLRDELLSKPVSHMTGDELGQLHRHPVAGQSALMALENLRKAGTLIRAHHERWDGQGYPDGLSGLAIPIGARLLAVANDFDGLQIGTLTPRKLRQEEALAFIQQNRGKRYCPQSVDALAAVLGSTESAPAVGNIVSTAALKPGMVLARDLVTPEGVMLLAADFVLDDGLIRQLRELEASEGRRLAIPIRAERKTTASM